MEADMTLCETSIIWFTLRLAKIYTDHWSSAAIAARLWIGQLIPGEIEPTEQMHGRTDETSPPEISASGRGRCRPARGDGRCAGANLSDAANPLACGVCCRRPR